jgi:hypothetical protein
MEGTRIPKKVFKAKFEGVRSVEKPNKRWEDTVQQDAVSFLRCRNWKLAADLGCSTIGWMEGSLCAEKPSIELYPKSVQSSPHLHPVTEYCGRVVNTHALYSGLPKLKSCPGD